ncbi:hypothetical protein Salpa_5396 [Sporomusa sp. KB1]|nr:hypothetical protein Salpa_5396 [Sporomusa sp. KB1]
MKKRIYAVLIFFAMSVAGLAVAAAADPAGLDRGRQGYRRLHCRSGCLSKSVPDLH